MDRIHLFGVRVLVSGSSARVQSPDSHDVGSEEDLPKEASIHTKSYTRICRKGTGV